MVSAEGVGGRGGTDFNVTRTLLHRGEIAGCLFDGSICMVVIEVLLPSVKGGKSISKLKPLNRVKKFFDQIENNYMLHVYCIYSN